MAVIKGVFVFPFPYHKSLTTTCGWFKVRPVRLHKGAVAAPRSLIVPRLSENVILIYREKCSGDLLKTTKSKGIGTWEESPAWLPLWYHLPRQSIPLDRTNKREACLYVNWKPLLLTRMRGRITLRRRVFNLSAFASARQDKGRCRFTKQGQRR